MLDQVRHHKPLESADELIRQLQDLLEQASLELAKTYDQSSNP